MEGTVQDTHKEQFMLKLMQRFIVLAVLGIGACILLGGMSMALFSGGRSAPDVAYVPRPIMESSGPADVMPQAGTEPRVGAAPQAPVVIPVPVERESRFEPKFMVLLVLLGGVAIICAFVYNMFRMYLQYKKSHDIDEAMFP
jgi:hypothetical protein